MPRRTVSNFSKGMVTDSIGEEGALAYIQDMYLRKQGELVSRGPVYANQRDEIALPATKYTVGYSTSSFHPNFGMGAIRAMHSTYDTSSNVRSADSFQLVGVGLQSADTNDTPQEGLSLVWDSVTEGTNKAQVYHSVSGTLRNLEACYQSFNTGTEMVFVGETGYVYKWGGSYNDMYATGTVSVSTSFDSNASVIVGSGTAWTTNVEVGQYIMIDGVAENAVSGEQRGLRITAINSDTELVVESKVFLATGNTGLAYRIVSICALNSPSGVWNGDTEKPFTVGVGCYHSQRIFTAGVSDVNTGYNSVFDFDSIRYSGTVLDYDNTGEKQGFSHMDLWHPNAQFHVMPGVGGFIRGLVSMNGNLIVIKSHGLFKISSGTSGFSWDGTGPLPGLSVISQTIGASGFRAWKDTPAGLIMANEQGLYLYDGNELNSLTNGRIDTLWESFAHYAVEYTVNCFGSLVTIGSATYPDLPCVVYDFEKDYFWIGTNMSFSTVSTLYGEDDIWLGHVGLAGHVLNMPQYEIDDVVEPRVMEMPSTDLSSVMHWNTDPAGTDLDASGVNTGPSPIIATHSIPLGGDDGPGDGRVNNVGVTIYSDRRTMMVLRPGESGVDQIVYSEHQSDGDDFGVTSGVTRIESTRWGGFLWGEGSWGSSLLAGLSSHGGFVEDEIPLSSEIGSYTGGYKNARVPVDSFPAAPFVSVVFKISDNYALDDVSYQVRIQAIYVDYEPTNNHGTI